MGEANEARVQEHPLQALAREDLVPGEVAVLVVARERKAQMGKMHSDLVRAAGLELGIEQRLGRIGPRPYLGPAEGRPCKATCGIDADAPLPLTRDVAREREIDLAQRVAPAAPDQHVVALVDRAVAQLRMQGGQRAALFRDEQHPGRLAVQPMHELEEARVGARLAQPLDGTERNAAAAMDRETGGLVEGHERLVLVKNRRQHDPRHAVGCADRRLRTGCRGANRRDPELVARLEPRVGPDLPAIHPHLPAAKDSVNVTFGDPFQDLDQVVVDALPLPVVPHCKPIHSRFA